MNFNYNLFAIIFFFGNYCGAQILQEVAPPENIKSVVFKSENDGDQFPIVKMGETFTLSFDDLYADEKDYYYEIEHCNIDWTPSKLLKSQYLSGIDNQRIINYNNSLSTIQPYTNYQLTLPNQQTKFRVSGNYILKVKDNTGELIFSRRFLIYKDGVTVGATVKRSRNMKLIDKLQRLEFFINYADYDIVNPQQEVKVVILQNSNFNNVVSGLKPQFMSGDQLIYKYDAEASFEGGNEYFWFDTKEIRVSSNAIARVDLTNRYNHYLYTNEIRKNNAYTYNPDTNGDYFIRTIDGVDQSANREADYSFVRFSLAYDNTIGLDDIYVYGKFNNYQLTKENKLTYNEKTNTLNTAILLKQGFYNYKFVKADKDGKIDLNFVSGSFWETENNYTILVYYRDFGTVYDSLIGVGSATSVNISN
ncbi:type IX secretion system plug protein [Joostella sp. CR20]|uniref:type IX secretion system plug protein n=1 Tax=Joostella sp. CR20 TaxID=2804312 RepID=UPI00313C98AD